MTRTVLVTGARGKTGREVVALLRDHADVAVRAGTSRPGATESAGNAEPIAFDWDDPATWKAAVEDADAVYLMRPDIPDAPERVHGVVELNPQAHVVLLSEQGAGGLAPDHWARRVEDAVTMHATTWTVLRPSWFHQILTDPRFFRDAIRDDHALSLPSHGSPLAWVDARDIAAVAVAALVAPDAHHGRAHTITGPAALTVDAVADDLAAALGHPIHAADPPIHEAVAGMDPWATGILEDLYRRVHDGGFAEVSGAVDEITGHPPRDIRSFIAEHVDAWRDDPARAAVG